jgi:hypothetical protein
VCAKADINFELLVTRNDFLLAKNGISEGWMEGFRENIFAVACEVEKNGIAGGDGPCDS